MTASPVLGGGVDNGRRGTAVFTFYSGPVGIRDRGDRLEVAFFGAAVTPALPVQGVLDGATVTVVEVTQRGVTDTPPPRGKRAAAPMMAIVATVIPAPSE